MRFSFTKRDSWVTNGTLALHFTVNFVDSTDGTQYFCKLLAISNQTKYNEEKRGGDIYGKNSKCICTC